MGLPIDQIKRKSSKDSKYLNFILTTHSKTLISRRRWRAPWIEHCRDGNLIDGHKNAETCLMNLIRRNGWLPLSSNIFFGPNRTGVLQSGVNLIVAIPIDEPDKGCLRTEGFGINISFLQAVFLMMKKKP
jgi:hypothetical protein